MKIKKWLINEMRIFSYNLKEIRSGLKEDLLDKRVNSETYLFLLICIGMEILLYKGYFQLLDKGIEITNQGQVMSDILFISFAVFQLLMIVKRRLQDTSLSIGAVIAILGIPIILILKITLDNFMEYNKIFERGIVYNPKYVLLLILFLVGVSFFRSDPKENKYGANKEREVRLFGKVIYYREIKDTEYTGSFFSGICMIIKKVCLIVIIFMEDLQSESMRFRYF